MSIASEISRLQTAKADMKTALEAKGVTVGTAKLDTYDALIAAISTGGGGSYSKVVRILTSSGTWTKPAGLVFLEVVCIGGGGGAASGSKTASGVVSRAGAGAGSGAISWGTFLESQLSGTEVYTVGAGGIGGVSITNNSTNGTWGSTGGTTFFGGTDFSSSKVCATGGIRAFIDSPGYSLSKTNQKPATTLPGLYGASSSFTGGVGSSGTSQNDDTNYNSLFGAASGGGITTANVQSAGGGGARYYNKSGTLSSLNGGAVATDGGDGVNYYMDRIPFIMGTAGTPYADVTIGYGTPGGGGGSSTSGNAGRGGDGGLYGGAGGGGGSARNDVGNSGRGGNGGAGVIILIEHIVA